MNAKTKVRSIGALLGAAGIVVFMAISERGDTGSAEQRMPATGVAVTAQARMNQPSPLLTDGMLGQALVEFLGVGLGFGLLAFGLGRVAAYRSERHHTATQQMPIASIAANPVVLVMVPRVADATASEFDDIKRPSFVPVTSFTEAQVRLRRDRREPRQRRAVPASA